MRHLQSFFHLENIPAAGSRLADIDHPFWSGNTLRTEMTNILVSNQPIRNKKYLVKEKNGNSKTILINTRIIEGNIDVGKRIFVIIDDLTE
jgi:hypothetical protein